MSNSSSNGKKVVILKSNDGDIFEVDEIVASESLTIKNMIEDVSAGNHVPLPNVTSKILAKVIEYCKKHAYAPKSVDAELAVFDAEFIRVDNNTLFDLMLAANYLNIKGLLGLTCQTAADMIKDMTCEEIRKTFNIKNDFTPEEEAAIRKENEWAFQ